MIATFGGGVEGATTTAVGADIVAFTKSRGAFAGVSLAGSVLSSRANWDQAYYGRPVDARAIVLQMAGSNPGADPLRALLTRYGSTGAAGAARHGIGQRPAGLCPAGRRRPAAQGYAQPGYAQPGYGQQGATAPSAGQPVQLAPGAPIQQQSLPPPTR